VGGALKNRIAVRSSTVNCFIHRSCMAVHDSLCRATLSEIVTIAALDAAFNFSRTSLAFLHCSLLNARLRYLPSSLDDYRVVSNEIRTDLPSSGVSCIFLETHGISLEETDLHSIGGNEFRSASNLLVLVSTRIIEISLLSCAQERERGRLVFSRVF